MLVVDLVELVAGYRFEHVRDFDAADPDRFRIMERVEVATWYILSRTDSSVPSLPDRCDNHRRTWYGLCRAITFWCVAKEKSIRRLFFQL